MALTRIPNATPLFINEIPLLAVVLNYLSRREILKSMDPMTALTYRPSTQSTRFW